MPDLFVSQNKSGHKPAGPTLKTPHSITSDVSAHKGEGMNKGTIEYPKNEEEKQFLPGHTNNPLAAFNYFPSKVDFVNKDPEEEVVLFLRKHPITNIKWMAVSFVMIIFPAFASTLPVFDNIPKSFSLLLVLSWYMVTLAYIFESFLNWFFSVNIVTDERLFDVDFYNLIYRKITDANIDQIQDVTVQIGGGLRTIFNYGDVIIQTASEIPEIEFEAIPMPDRVAKVLRALRVEEEVEKLEGRVR